MSKITFNASAPIGSQANPFPAGTSGGDANIHGGKWCFRKGFDGTKAYEADNLLQFTASGGRKGKVFGSSNGYAINIPALLAAKPSVPAVPTLTGDATADAAVRKNHSVALGKAVLALIAPAVMVKLGAAPARKITVPLSADEVEAAAKKAGAKSMKEIIAFCSQSANMVRVEDVKATDGTPQVLADIGVAEIPAGEVASISEKLNRAVRDAVNAIAAELETDD